MILIRKFIISNRLRYDASAIFTRLYLYNITIETWKYTYPLFNLKKEKKCFIKIIESDVDLRPNMCFVTFKFQSMGFINISILSMFNKISFSTSDECRTFSHTYCADEIQSFINEYTKFYKSKVL